MQPKPLIAIVVDDEKPSREALVTYIRDFCQQVEVIAECDSVRSAYQAIQKYQPHLVFLDIEMPNGNGFDLLQLFKNPCFKIIFVSAFSDYAIRAFRYSAIDYLLKPVKVDELIEAVEKVKNEIELGQTNPGVGTIIESIGTSGKQLRKLVLPHPKGYIVIELAEVIFCQSEGYITHFFLTGKRKVSSTKNLKFYEETFDPNQIMRVHRSFMVNLSHVKGYTNVGEIQLTDNLTSPLSDGFKQKFIERLMI